MDQAGCRDRLESSSWPDPNARQVNKAFLDELEGKSNGTVELEALRFK